MSENMMISKRQFNALIKAVEVHLKTIESLTICTTNSYDTDKLEKSIQYLKDAYNQLNMNEKTFSELKRKAYAQYIKAKKELYLIDKEKDSFNYDLKCEEVNKNLKNYIQMKELCKAFKD